MRIMYFGKNKEDGLERTAVIRFTDDEFDLYKYIENYEHTYGDGSRRFACGGLIGIERNEKGVWINESYISVDDFSDFNDFKANYKEAKKEFRLLKNHSTDTELETSSDSETVELETSSDPETVEPETSSDPETVEPEMFVSFDDDGDIENAYCKSLMICTEYRNKGYGTEVLRRIS